MIVLSFDPGAERMGYAVLKREKNRTIAKLGYGQLGVPRQRNKENKQEAYHEYRMKVIDFWLAEAPALIESFAPDIIVNEIVPVVGGGNFVVATQSQLAGTAITIVQAVAKQRGVPIEQVGATTVKARIGGGKKATKVAVRNGVFKIMPELEVHKKEWTKVFDISDAFAIGLTYLGCDIKKENFNLS